MDIRSRTLTDKLLEHAQDVVGRRALERLQGADARARKEAIDDSPRIAEQGFWCGECDADFDTQGLKQVRLLTDGTLVAWYYGWCPVGHRVLRYITDKHRDPYYRESFIVRRQAIDFVDDLMQPTDPRFALRYPEAYAAWQDQQNESHGKAVLE